MLADIWIFHRVGGAILSRWVHFLAGITWIGLLYYFNFVQVPSFALFEAGPRTEAVRKLVPRALWWFRWAAALTVLSGVGILAAQEQLDKASYFITPPGLSILTGIFLGLIMFGNVWLVIWPNQQIVIASAERVAAGGEADPAAATAGRKALLASRTNTMFSFPLLFFMGATSHFAGVFTRDSSGRRVAYYLVTLVGVGILELNALGLVAGLTGPTKRYLETHRDTIIAGFALAVIFYIGFQVLFG